jgi:hypothetical protein
VKTMPAMALTSRALRTLIIDFGETIGAYIDPATGAEVPSTKGIMYSKRGVHSYPVRP